MQTWLILEAELIVALVVVMLRTRRVQRRRQRAQFRRKRNKAYQAAWNRIMLPRFRRKIAYLPLEERDPQIRL